MADIDGWVRVPLRAERLDWVPAVLAGLGLPFAVEHPDALRGFVRSLAERLTAAADADTVHADASAPDGEVVDRDPR